MRGSVCAASVSNGTQSVSPLQPASSQRRLVADVGDDEPRLRDGEALREILGAQLLGARQHDEALAEAGEHRQRPLRAVADEREDDVAAADAERVERAGQARRPRR